MTKTHCDNCPGPDIRRIAEVCLTLRKRANFFQDNEPEHLNREDFDAIAAELEAIADLVDGFLVETTGKWE